MRSWFKWYNGTVTDPKFRLISLESGQSIGDIIAIWAILLERANESDEKGSFAGLCTEAIDALLSLPKGTTECILNQMIEAGLVMPDMCIKNWEKLQGTPSCIERQLDVSLTEWSQLRSAVFERDGYVCQYCGKKIDNPECDHVFPLSRGGHSNMSNLVTACQFCNRSKGAKTLDEWRHDI